MMFMTRVTCLSFSFHQCIIMKSRGNVVGLISSVLQELRFTIFFFKFKEGLDLCLLSVNSW